MIKFINNKLAATKSQCFSTLPQDRDLAKILGFKLNKYKTTNEMDVYCIVYRCPCPPFN